MVVAAVCTYNYCTRRRHRRRRGRTSRCGIYIIAAAAARE